MAGSGTEDAPETPAVVIGGGSWGTALGLVLARKGALTFLWDSDRAHIEKLRKQGSNETHLPGIRFPDTLVPVADLSECDSRVRDVIVAVPCEFLRAALGTVRGSLHPHMRLCLASKGMEPGTFALNHDVARECLGDAPVAVLSGPSFAREVAAGLPTAVTVAASSAEVAGIFAERFHGDAFRVYTHTDVIGVQVGGAVKNVMAIAAGISDGLGFGANARAALITRGLAEIIRLGLAMGGQRDTFMGLTGLGDLVLTCTDDQSRNRRLGLALARGTPMAQARREIGQAVEGIRTAGAVHELAARYRVEMPISTQVQRVLEGSCTPEHAVRQLLERGRKAEQAG